MPNNIVETHGLTKVYGAKKALDCVDFALPSGEILGLVGKNGAGKTTLIRVLSGLTRPSSGSYSLFGISDPKKLEEAHRGVVSMIEKPLFHSSLSAEKNIALRALAFGFRGDLDAYASKTLDEVGLSEVKGTGKKAGSFSLGMKQRLGIALALVQQPKLMLLDEPTNGLDPEGIQQFRLLLQKLNAQGITILVSSHILGELGRFATSFCFMELGRILSCLNKEELEKKQGRRFLFQTEDPEKVLQILLETGLEAKREGDFIVVKGYQKSSDVVQTLVRLNLPFDSPHEEEMDLESFYLSLMEEGEEK